MSQSYGKKVKKKKKKKKRKEKSADESLLRSNLGKPVK